MRSRDDIRPRGPAIRHGALAMIWLVAALGGCKLLPGPASTPHLTLGLDRAQAGDPAAASRDDPKGLLVAPTPLPRPIATPSATPAPAQRHLGDAFAITYPPTWREAFGDGPDVVFALQAPAASGQLLVTAEPAGETTLAARLGQAKDLAADGLIAVKGLTIDELKGYQLTSNHLTPDGPRYVRQYIFLYRHQFISLTASWDKLDLEAPVIQLEVEAIIKAWRWL